MIESLKNLIPCDKWETPFVDAYSQFSLGFRHDFESCRPPAALALILPDPRILLKRKFF